MLRNIFAIIAGLLSAFITIFVLEKVSHIIYPLPEGIDLNNPEAVKELMKNAPIGALLIVLGAWILGSFDGAMIAHLIAADSKTRKAVTVGIILTAAGAANMLMIPHPVWFVASGLICFIPVSFIGSKVMELILKKRSEEKQ